MELKRKFFILLISQIFSCYGLNFFLPLPTFKFFIWYGCYLGVSYWCSRVKLEKVLLFEKKMFTCFGLKIHPCDHINLLIAPKLHDAIDRRATLSCDNSGFSYVYLLLSLSSSFRFPVSACFPIPLLFPWFRCRDMT